MRKYKRVLLKLSGEALQGGGHYGIDPKMVDNIAEQLKEVKGKPENIIEKILNGKLDKFYQAHCLIEQPFIKDDKQSVKSLMEQVSKQIGDAVQIKQFVRFQLGETVAG